MRRILFAIPVLALIAGCGGGGGGGGSAPPPPPTKYVSGVAMIAPKALHPMMMVAEVVTPGEEAELNGLTYCQITPTTGSGVDDTNTYPSNFRLALPANPVIGKVYHLVVFNDKDADGIYDIGSDTVLPEFMGDWSDNLVYDGTKWSVAGPFGVPEWGADATSTGNNISVEAKYSD